MRLSRLRFQHIARSTLCCGEKSACSHQLFFTTIANIRWVEGQLKTGNLLPSSICWNARTSLTRSSMLISLRLESSRLFLFQDNLACDAKSHYFMQPQFDRISVTGSTHFHCHGNFYKSKSSCCVSTLLEGYLLRKVGEQFNYL